MFIDVLASGSSGNATIISDGKTKLLIDCGISYTELQSKTNFTIPTVDGCLITHEHG